MRSNKANIYDLKLIFHGDDQSIAIAFDIEHNPVVSQAAGSTVGILNIPSVAITLRGSDATNQRFRIHPAGVRFIITELRGRRPLEGEPLQAPRRT